ncbi:MAG: hypothetical protein AAF698_00390 [Pseudomonadota bacterium]
MTATLPPPLWLADLRIPLRARLTAFVLLRARIRRAWMRLDPYFLLTFVVLVVSLRIGFRLATIDVTIANLLAGTVFGLLVLIASLGALTKRSDRREVRVTERRLRMFGYRLTALGRLEAGA